MLVDEMKKGLLACGVCDYQLLAVYASITASAVLCEAR